MANFFGKNIYRPPARRAPPFWEKGAKSRRQSFSREGREGGMTLLEALLALSLFSFMFVFISQAARQGYRQTRALKKDMSLSASLSNVLDLIRGDFQGAGYFLDINDNFRLIFGGEGGAFGLLPESGDSRPQAKRAYPVLLSPYFVFEGERDEIQFVSYSFSGASEDQSSAQWIKIRYFLKNCAEGEGFCLFRSSDRHWPGRDIEKEPEESFVLLKNLKSLKFSYASSEDLLDGEWRDKWRPERVFSPPNSPLAYPRQLPFPSSVKMEIEGERGKRALFFPVSYSYLRDWNPYSRAYPGFPSWTPPKKKPKKKTKARAAPPAARGPRQ